MTAEELRATVGGSGPPAGSSLAVQGLWWAAKGDWERAHGCVQQAEGMAECDWVHAYLHRVEGDLGNAGYWYRRAGRKVAAGALDREWAEIAAALLG